MLILNENIIKFTVEFLKEQNINSTLVQQLENKLINKMTSSVKSQSSNGIKGKRTPYIFFYKEKRLEILLENPGITNKEIAKIIGPIWKSLSCDEQKPYFDKSLSDKIRYKNELANLPQKKVDDETNLTLLNITTIRKKCKEFKIKGYSTKSRDVLLILLTNHIKELK